jgi:hypothetical protein
MYMWASAITGNTFQEIPRLRENANNTESYIYVPYVNTVMFN